MCVRGASALQTVLGQQPRRDLSVFVVWEPILFSDLAPPTTWALARISDARATQFWDPGHLVSAELIRSGQVQASSERPAWDLVAIYPPGVRWETTLPAPVFQAVPVVAGMAEVRERLRK